MLGGDAVEDEVEAPACFCISSASRETTTSSAPRRRASSVLSGEVVKTTTWAPEGAGELDAHVAEAAEADDADLLALRRPPSDAWASRS